MPYCVKCESLGCEHARSCKSSPGFPLLTHFDIALLGRLADGQTAKEIAFDMKKKAGFVSVLITQLRHRLRLDSKVALIEWATKNLRVTGEK